MTKFRAIALNQNNTASTLYGPVRTVKADAEQDRVQLHAQHPELPTTSVIGTGDPLWKDN
jgi:hypothetical protein